MEKEKFYGAASFALVLFSALLVKLSGFSASYMVNFQNYIIKTGVSQTSGMSTISALYYFFSPFFAIFAALIMIAVALVLAGLCGDDKYSPALIAGILSALSYVLIFRSVWGAFVGVGLLAAFFYAAKMAPVYREEIKKWIGFRTGSKTVSRALFIANVIISLGVLFAVLSAQAEYGASFRSEMTVAMKSVVRSMPGASTLSDSALTLAVENVVNSSEIFNAYVRWLPVTTALGVWFVLEMLRNIFLANIGGLVSLAISKVNKEE